VTRLDRATLGLRALYELYLLDDSFDDLVMRAERAIASPPPKHSASAVAAFGSRAHYSAGDRVR